MTLLIKNGTRHGMSATRRLVLCCVLFCAQETFLFSQNLVPNPSFELIDSCPQYPYVLGYQPGAVPLYWFSSSDTPDYFNACEDTVTDVPTNIFGHQYAMDGQAYSGMFSYFSFGDFREMVSVELSSPMVVGETYFASFYANAAYGGYQEVAWACSNLGLLFCMDPNYYDLFTQQPPFELRNYAHVWSSVVISDTANWVLVSGSFVADSAYRFMVVGNQFNDANTTVDSLGPGYPWAYQFVDQFCVSIDPLGCPLANSINGPAPSLAGVFPNPAQDKLHVTWQSQWTDRLSVSDMIGRLIWQKQVDGSEEVTLDVGTWARGQYILTYEGEVRRSFKFVLVE